MEHDAEGFVYPIINSELCVKCGACIDVCPEASDIKQNDVKNQKAYYGWHKDDHIRQQSSSGGVFSAISQWIMYNEGVVWGAIFDYNQTIVHHKSTSYCRLSEMRKSKYVQSYIGNSYQDIKKDLDLEILVLFVGTPCQVSGLKSFLSRKYENLLTVDFICHGVPSMKLLREYLSIKEKWKKDKIKLVDFRSKIGGWSKMSLNLVFKNNLSLNIPWYKDSYYRAFIKNISLRSSCYKCSYANDSHKSDITIADFWGVHKYNSLLNDEKGVSLIIRNNHIGETFLDKIGSNHLFIRPLKWEYAKYVYSDRCCNKSYNLDSRDAFYNCFTQYGYKKAVKKSHLTNSYFKDLYTKVSLIVKKITNPR